MQTKLLINGKLVASGGEVEQVDSEMPHGGLKRSVYGKDLSMYALEDCTVVRHVMAKL
jgi:hypothetical protein